MSAEEVARLESAPKPARTRASAEAETDDVSATVMATARTRHMNAAQSAIGSATVEGNASLETALAGMVSSKGDATLKQGCAGALVAEGDITVSQGGGAVLIGKSLDIDQGGGAVIVSGETNASRSYVGLLMSRKATFSEDSRVLFDWKAALILAAVVLGGVGVVILIAVLVARMVAGRVHRVAEHLPHIPTPHLPEIPPWVSAVARRIRAA